MRKINAVGNVGGQFADYDPNTNPQGTVYSAQWGNDTQDDLIKIQEEVGVAEGSGADSTLLKSMIKLMKEQSKNVGELFFLHDYKPLVGYDNTSVASAKTYFPAECMNVINVQKVVDVANYPDWVPILRARKLSYLSGESGEASSWTSTVAGSVVTMPSSTSSDAILRALAEDSLVHGGFTDFRTLTISGTEYPITNINTVTREITVTGTPTAGSQTVEFFYHRIAGSTTTARVFKASGRSLITANDSEGRHIAGLRVRDRLQNITGSVGTLAGNNNANLILPARSGAFGVTSKSSSQVLDSIPASFTGLSSITFDASGSPNARTGLTTHSPGLGVYLYEHVGRYLP